MFEGGLYFSAFFKKKYSFLLLAKKFDSRLMCSRFWYIIEGKEPKKPSLVGVRYIIFLFILTGFSCSVLKIGQN